MGKILYFKYSSANCDKCYSWGISISREQKNCSVTVFSFFSGLPLWVWDRKHPPKSWWICCLKENCMGRILLWLRVISNFWVSLKCSQGKVRLSHVPSWKNWKFIPKVPWFFFQYLIISAQFKISIKYLSEWSYEFV